MGVIPLELVASPRGLGTVGVESLSGYCARLSVNIAVATGMFVKCALDCMEQHRQPKRLYNVVLNTRSGAVNRCGDLARGVHEAVRILTHRQQFLWLSYLAFVDAFGFSDRELLSRQRRLCPKCWEEDGDEPYERKASRLVAVHDCLLESRCPTCAWTQPAPARGVRRHTCSYCGHDLLSDPVPLGGGRAAERLLWYARERSLLVHAGEVASLVGDVEDGAGPIVAYPRLARWARERVHSAVERFFLEEVSAKGGDQLEPLFRAQWRLSVGVLKLFSSGAHSALALAPDDSLLDRRTPRGLRGLSRRNDRCTEHHSSRRPPTGCQ